MPPAIAIRLPYIGRPGQTPLFALITDGPPLQLDLIARANTAGHVTALVNHTSIDALILALDWRRLPAAVHPRHLRRGLNHIRLAWGEVNMDDSAALAEAERRLAMGIDADLLPVFGDVFGLTAPFE